MIYLKIFITVNGRMKGKSNFFYELFQGKPLYIALVNFQNQFIIHNFIMHN